MRSLLTAAFVFFSWCAFAQNASLTTSFNLPTGDVIHYISTSGSDSNNGLTPATAWATPNHAMNCGDVIIAQAGTYTSAFTNWGTVSNCPSTSGGIDGLGGVYFATVLCAGPDLNSCNMSISSASSPGFTVQASNWAVEGWRVTGNGTNARAFEAKACANGTTILHHIAFVNDISFNSKQGYDTNECALNHNDPGNGVDYFAVVGSIAQNSAQDTICLGAIDVVGPSHFDNNPGTHFLIYGNFSYNHSNTCNSDVEAFMFDTWDAHNTSNQGVIMNNIGWAASRYNIQLFFQNLHTNTPSIFVQNNTLYDSNINTNTDFADGDINIQSTVSSLPWVISVTNNIAGEKNATPGGGASGAVYAFLIGGNYATTIVGGATSQNIFKGLATSCKGSSCDAGNNVTAFNGGSFGTNTYVDPVFTNTADLLANQSGAPTCTGFTNVTACMGYNAATKTLMVPSVISDLTPTASGMTGKGYQLPTTSRTDNSLYPTWLKGIVYLQWNAASSSITEMSDLVTRPCGL